MLYTSRVTQHYSRIYTTPDPHVHCRGSTRAATLAEGERGCTGLLHRCCVCVHVGRFYMYIVFIIAIAHTAYYNSRVGTYNVVLCSNNNNNNIIFHKGCSGARVFGQSAFPRNRRRRLLVGKQHIDNTVA